MQRIRNTANAPAANQGPFAAITTHADTDSRDAAKLIRPRSLPRDAVRKYFRCQARREFDAARVLQKWNVPSIPVHGWGLALAPWARYESVLLMDYLPDCLNARRYLESKHDLGLKWHFLEGIARDVTNIYARGYHHNDCHLGNVLVDTDGNRMWVDNELRRINSEAEHSSHFEQTLDLLDRSMKQALPDGMKKEFRARCRERLSRKMVD